MELVAYLDNIVYSMLAAELAAGPGLAPVILDIAYLQSGIVDSTHDRPDERRGRPVGATSTDHRK